MLVEVSDTGCGIEPEETERIFEHLYQVTDLSKSRATRSWARVAHRQGLGHAPGGKIWVTSVPGKGSVFSFTLPIFSLASLIRPILAEQKAPGSLLALFVAHIECRDGSLDVPGKALDVARMALQKCLRAGTDVLLPNIGPVDEHKLFFVVANTQPRDAKMISNRILGQLRSSKNSNRTT